MLLQAALLVSCSLAFGRDPAIDVPHPINADPSVHVWSDGKLYA
jgi:hypothetical protein